MVAKLRLRIVDGIPEVDGDPDQIMEVLRRLSISQSTQPKLQREERESSNIKDIERIDSEKLVKIIESSGDPITFSMGDLQKKIYGRRISSRDEKKLYQTFRIAFDNAKKQVEKTHPDHHWEDIMTHVDDMPTKRFTLVRNHPLPVQQQIKAPDETPKTQPHEEEVDIFNL